MALTDCERVLAVLGALSLLVVAVRTTLSVWKAVKTFFLARWLPEFYQLNLKDSFGPWAVVTGASDGIGKAYSQELARRGLNVVLISRSKDKLDAVAKDIENCYAVKTRTVAVDFSHGPEIYEQLARELADIEVGVLVNNVGMSRGLAALFVECTDDDQVHRDMISVNCEAVTFMTRLVLPGMVERKRGLIVNVASILGTIPTPMAAVYSATKAYVDFFSRALDAEYKSKGITVQCVLPGSVVTAMSGQSTTSLLAPDPATYVKSALATVAQQTRTFGYWPHALMMWTFLSLPESVFQMYFTRLLRQSPGRLRWLEEQRAAGTLKQNRRTLTQQS